MSQNITWFDSFASDFDKLANDYLAKKSDTALTKIDKIDALELSLNDLTARVDGLSGNADFISALQNSLTISTLGELTTNGALTVNGDATFGGNVKFNGSVTNSTNNIQSDYQVKDSDNSIYADASNGPITITLPFASAGTIGRSYYVYKIDGSTNPVTIAGSGTNSVNGNSVIKNQWGALRVTGYTDSSWIGTGGQ